jgi:hypothetical protein
VDIKDLYPMAAGLLAGTIRGEQIDLKRLTDPPDDRPVWLMGKHGPAIRFASIASASRQTGISKKLILESCESEGDGFIFRFAQEER